MPWQEHHTWAPYTVLTELQATSGLSVTVNPSRGAELMVCSVKKTTAPFQLAERIDSIA